MVCPGIFSGQFCPKLAKIRFCPILKVFCTQTPKRYNGMENKFYFILFYIISTNDVTKKAQKSFNLWSKMDILVL